MGTEPVPHEDLEPDTGTSPSGPWDGVAITNPQLAGIVATHTSAARTVADARAALTQARAAADAAAATRDELSANAEAAAERYRDTRARFAARVAANYVAAGDIDISLRPAKDLAADADRVVLPGAVTDADAELAAEHLAARDAIDGRLATAIEEAETTARAADIAADALTQAEAALEAAATALTATPAELPGFVFPVAGPTSFISSFGFCRDGCRRSHQGNDLFAARGTPVVAVEDGWVERVGTNRLGGLIVWTRGRSGYRYYYAHLAEFAPIVAGQEIVAGTVVGTVGDTGNARGTPPHLHFEIHPPGTNGAIDPYPILVQAPRVTVNAAPTTTSPAAASSPVAPVPGAAAPPGP
jgi:murein DD-endopeptidase MepM/ murein hydrolase activator NlpD